MQLVYIYLHFHSVVAGAFTFLRIWQDLNENANIGQQAVGPLKGPTFLQSTVAEQALIHIFIYVLRDYVQQWRA